MAGVDDRLHALLAGEHRPTVHAHPAGAADHHPAALAVRERAVEAVLDDVEAVEETRPLGRLELVQLQRPLADSGSIPPDLEALRPHVRPFVSYQARSTRSRLRRPRPAALRCLSPRRRQGASKVTSTPKSDSSIDTEPAPGWSVAGNSNEILRTRPSPSIQTSSGQERRSRVDERLNRRLLGRWGRLQRKLEVDRRPVVRGLRPAHVLGTEVLLVLAGRLQVGRAYRAGSDELARAGRGRTRRARHRSLEVDLDPLLPPGTSSDEQREVQVDDVVVPERPPRVASRQAELAERGPQSRRCSARCARRNSNSPSAVRVTGDVRRPAP